MNDNQTTQSTLVVQGEERVDTHNQKRSISVCHRLLAGIYIGTKGDEITNQYRDSDGRNRFSVGKLNSKKPIETAIFEIKGWLEKLGVDGLDISCKYSGAQNIAVLNFKYEGKDYEFRSMKQRDAALNMWAIQHVIEYKVRAHIMEIEKFETSMSPYLALSGTGSSKQDFSFNVDEKSYIVLGMPATASNEQLKVRYKELVKSYHPDMLSGINSNEAKKAFEAKLSEINEAWMRIKKERGIE